MMATPKNQNQTAAPDRSDAIADFARTLSTPLDGLMAMGELLQRQALAPAAQAQVWAIMEAGRRIVDLIYDAIDLGDAQPALALEPAALRELVDDVDALWRSKTKARGPKVLISCNAPANLQVMLDPSRTRRFLNALIAENFEANDWGVIELQLVMRLEGDSDVVVSGRLEAPGCATGCNDSTTVQFGHAFCRQMDGALSRTDAKGSGALTTFELRLKRADHAQADDADADADEGPLPARTHLLIVDDNATNRIVAAALCDMFGCTSETAEDGLEALEAAKSRHFDLILMDIKMPRMDGLEATKAIRALSGPAANTPIVALTANAGAEAAASYLAAGMRAVVDKPIKPDQLLSTLQWVLCGDQETPVQNASAA